MPVKLEATAPVLVASDVASTARWYQEFLQFKVSLFPETPPFAFAILCRDSVEIMLRRCGSAGPFRPDGDWNVYIRAKEIRELLRALEGRVAIVEPLRTAEYGCLEFAVEDPNGYRLVFSEETKAEGE